jgi:hypothetical protein
MGQAKRRRDQLGALYGTPEGSNRPQERIWDGLDTAGHVVIHAQAMADADRRPRALWMHDPGDPKPLELQVRWAAPDPEPVGLRWVPPTHPKAALTYRHPVWIQRSSLSGKWAVTLQASTGDHVLDVFHDLADALKSAQNAQVVFGTAPATVDADAPAWLNLLQCYGAADATSGIDSDDEAIAATEPGDHGFRVLNGTGAIPPDHLGLVVDAMRQSDIHVRLPGKQR